MSEEREGLRKEKEGWREGGLKEGGCSYGHFSFSTVLQNALKEYEHGMQMQITACSPIPCLIDAPVGYFLPDGYLSYISCQARVMEHPVDRDISWNSPQYDSMQKVALVMVGKKMWWMQKFSPCSKMVIGM